MLTLLVLAAASLVLVRQPRGFARASYLYVARINLPVDILAYELVSIRLGSSRPVNNTHIRSAVVAEYPTKSDVLAVLSNVDAHAEVGLARGSHRGTMPLPSPRWLMYVVVFPVLSIQIQSARPL